eukprot:365530-Chlamydomonas_euryale.AAC.16
MTCARRTRALTCPCSTSAASAAAVLAKLRGKLATDAATGLVERRCSCHWYLEGRAGGALAAEAALRSAARCACVRASARPDALGGRILPTDTPLCSASGTGSTSSARSS